MKTHATEFRHRRSGGRRGPSRAGLELLGRAQKLLEHLGQRALGRGHGDDRGARLGRAGGQGQPEPDVAVPALRQSVGRDVTDRYAEKRRELLLSLIDRMSQSGSMFENVNRTLWLMSGFYEQAARTVSVMSYLSDSPTVLSLEDKVRKAPRARAEGASRTRKAAGR